MPAVFSGYYHAGYLCECAGDANDSAHAEKKRERNLYQKVTRVLLYLSGMGVGLFFLIYFLTHQLTQTLVALSVPNSQCAYQRNRRTLNRFVGATKAYVFLWLARSDDHIFLQQGWRLVEIFVDLSNAAKDHSVAATINLVWLFEKEASRVNAYSCFS